MKISPSLCLFTACISGMVGNCYADLDTHTIGGCFYDGSCDPEVSPFLPNFSFGDCSCVGTSFNYTDDSGDAKCVTFLERNLREEERRHRALGVSDSRRLALIFWVVVILICSSLPANAPGTNRALQDGSCTTVEMPTQCDAALIGEPHIKQLLGGWFDYHGECDLVFAHAPDFGNGVGLDIHARTRIRYDYSFIESLAIRIGADILEVAGFGHYLLNGVSNADLDADTLSGFSVGHIQISEKEHAFEIDIGNGNAIAVDIMKDIVSIKIIAGGGMYDPDMHSWFDNSTGLLGSLSTNKMVARDGTVMTDANEFGQEWQVLDGEPKLFQVLDRSPQFPEHCRLPTAAAKESRRLLGGSISREVAKEACKDWIDEEKEGCIYDVMATGDLDLAQVGAY